MNQQFTQAMARLNDDQRRAVETIYGPVFVVAGPGTGKTQLLALRIAHILSQTDVASSSVLALTFTEAGVKAMKERLTQFLGASALGLNIFTFHGFCTRLITEYPERFSFHKDLIAISDLRRRQLLVARLQSLTPESPLFDLYDPKRDIADYLTLFSGLKRELYTPESLRELRAQALQDLETSDEYVYKKNTQHGAAGEKKKTYYQQKKRLQTDAAIIDLYQQYQTDLRDNGYYDFDDMISFVTRELETDPEFRLQVQEEYQFVLVDEYQDSNGLQNKLVDLLLLDREYQNVLVVGDDDQSIYRFQGAMLEHIVDFFQRYIMQAGGKTVVLRENYRSTQQILDASRRVIRQNTESLEELVAGFTKELHGQKQGADIAILRYESEAAELYDITRRVQETLARGIPADEIAIIYRKKRNALALIEALKKEHIPFQTREGENILHEKQIQNLLSLFQVIESCPSGIDDEKLFTLLGTDIFAFSSHEMFRLYDEAKKRKGPFNMYLWELATPTVQDVDMNLFDTLLEATTPTTPIESMIQKLRAARALLEQLFAMQHNVSTLQYFEKVIHAFDYVQRLKNAEDYYTLSCLTTLWDELKTFIGEQPDASFTDFVAYLTELEEYGLAPKTVPIRTSRTGIQLLTAHGAKGLEFHTVFVYQCTGKNWENQRAPQRRNLTCLRPAQLSTTEKEEKKNQQTQDERRLFYVAMTRAKEQLFLTYADVYDGREALPSCFVLEAWVSQDMPEVFALTDVQKQQMVDLQLTLANTDDVQYDMNHACVEQKIAEYAAVSISHLHTWMESPRKFLEQDILRLPQTKSIPAVFGSLMHKWLEEAVRMHKLGLDIRTDSVALQQVFETLTKQLHREVSLTQTDKSRILMKVQKDLEWYLHAKDPAELFAPWETEVVYGSAAYPIFFQSYKLQGRFDRTIFFPDNSVQVRDYKTGALPTVPRAGSKEAINPLSKYNKYRRQIAFYKLLWDHKPHQKQHFHSWVIELIQQNDDTNEIQTISFFPTEEDRAELVTLIEQFYTMLQNREFPVANPFVTAVTDSEEDLTV